MSKTAAIVTEMVIPNDRNQLKQALLLFDMVGVQGLPVNLGLLKMSARNATFADELEILRDKNYLIDVHDYYYQESRSETLIMKIAALLRQSYKCFLANYVSGNLKSIPIAYEASYLNLLNEENLLGFQSVPLLKNLQLPKQLDSVKTDVINLLIQQIPMPDETTPWEAIFDFKSDEDNKGRMAALRKWVNKTVQSNLSPAEISDEIEDLMYRYKKSLDIHKIKHRKSVLQTIVVGSAELLENAARLKFSNIAKGFFKINEAKADLMQLELTAPGNELAYIYQTQQRFSGKEVSN